MVKILKGKPPSGCGCGCGYGCGDGCKEYWKAAVKSYLNRLGIKTDGIVAYWKSDIVGKPANGGTSDEPVKAGTIQKVEGPLRLCSAKALHATFLPTKWKGKRLWLVLLRGHVRYQDDKLGSLEREIIAEIPMPWG